MRFAISKLRSFQLRQKRGEQMLAFRLQNLLQIKVWVCFEIRGKAISNKN